MRLLVNFYTSNIEIFLSFSDAASKITKVDDDTYMVPSGNKDTPDLFYEVIKSIGWCSCYIGKHGAFCKHQALAGKVFGGFFPNAPAINGKARYELGKLALGDRCPEPSFFLAIGENPFEVRS